jgi:hypothetical protein
MSQGLYATLVWRDPEWKLTIYRRNVGPIALVLGSKPYILRALAALGLSPSVSSFSEDWDRSGVTFFGD